MVGLQTLTLPVGVRIPASQLFILKDVRHQWYSVEFPLRKVPF